MSADDTVFSALEDAVSALVAEKHGPDCVVGSWVLVAESIAPEDGKDRSAASSSAHATCTRAQ